MILHWIMYSFLFDSLFIFVKSEDITIQLDLFDESKKFTEWSIMEIVEIQAHFIFYWKKKTSARKNYNSKVDLSTNKFKDRNIRNLKNLIPGN